MIMNESLTPQQAEMLSIFQTHMNAELEGNLEITMETMSENPHLNHVPVMAGEKEGMESDNFTEITWSENFFLRTLKSPQ
jgi:hypothetical protein